MKCSTHPRYKGIRQPRVACRQCWELFLREEREADLAVIDKAWNDLKSAVLRAVPNLPTEIDWADAEQLIRKGIAAALKAERKKAKKR